MAHPLRGLLALSALLYAFTAAAGDWPQYGGEGGRKFSPYDQINRDNVGQLAVAWQYHTGELERRGEFANKTAKVQVNPILLPPEAGGT